MTHTFFILYNSVICIKSFNILFYSILYKGHIHFNYTDHFVYSPLNSYVYIHWILDFRYNYIIIIILILLYKLFYKTLFIAIHEQSVEHGLWISDLNNKQNIIFLLSVCDRTKWTGP